MKKIGKIQINPEKIMDSKELLKLRGGYDGCICECYDWNHQFIRFIGGDVNALTCNSECLFLIEHGYGYWNC